jgi:hypothetical protein
MALPQEQEDAKVRADLQALAKIKPSRLWFFVFGRVTENRPPRKAFGIQWRGGFIGILLTEMEEEK